MDKTKTPPHPHLVPAIRQWLLESYPVVHFQVMTSKVTPDLSALGNQDGTLVLSVGPHATREFRILDGTVSFYARLSGKECCISFPTTAVLGLVGYPDHPDEKALYYPLPPWEDDVPTKPKAGPTLRVVK